MKQAIIKNGKVLTLFAITATAIVGLVSQLTSARIAQQEQKQLLNTLNTIISPERYNNEIYNDCVLVNNLQFLGSKDSQTAYLAKLDGQPVAAAISTIAPDGYSGNIHLLVAMNIDGTVSGVRTLKHQETPGLGDKIEERKDDWITSFTGKKLASEKDPLWKVKKDGGVFDQFTGATITPRAVVKAVKNTAIFFERNKDELFNRASSCHGDSNNE